jgi:hypothetical protein
MKTRALMFAALLLCGCATGYQVDGFTGGQTPKWRATDVLEVEASGNGYTKSSRLKEMTLLRAAETAIEARYRYFIEIGSEDTGGTSTVRMPETRTTTYTGQYIGNTYNSTSTTTYGGGPMTIYKPGVNAVYRMFVKLPADARPGQFHDAYEIYNRLGKKYIKRFNPKAPPA